MAMVHRVPVPPGRIRVQAASSATALANITLIWTPPPCLVNGKARGSYHLALVKPLSIGSSSCCRVRFTDEVLPPTRDHRRKHTPGWKDTPLPIVPRHPLRGPGDAVQAHPCVAQA